MRPSNYSSAFQNIEHFVGSAASLQEKIDRGELASGELLMDVDLVNQPPRTAHVVGSWLRTMAEQPKTFFRLDAYRMKPPSSSPPPATWRAYRLSPGGETLPNSTSIWLSQEALQNWLPGAEAKTVESWFSSKAQTDLKLAKAIAKETAMFERLLHTGVFGPEESEKKRLEKAEEAVGAESASLVELVGFISEISKLMQDSLLVVGDNALSENAKYRRLESICNTPMAGGNGTVGGIPLPRCINAYNSSGRRAVDMGAIGMSWLLQTTRNLEISRQEVAEATAKLEKHRVSKEIFLRKLETLTPQELATERAHRQKGNHEKGKRSK